MNDDLNSRDEPSRRAEIHRLAIEQWEGDLPAEEEASVVKRQGQRRLLVIIVLTILVVGGGLVYLASDAYNAARVGRPALQLPWE